jgi:tellurite resistance protein TehA-like permease
MKTETIFCRIFLENCILASYPQKRSRRAKLWTMMALVGLGVATAFAIVDAINESAAATSTPEFIYFLLTGIPLAVVAVIGLALIFSGRRR